MTRDDDGVAPVGASTKNKPELRLPSGVDPAVAEELVEQARADAGLVAVADRRVDQARADGVALTGEGGLLTDLIRQVLQGALEAEITDHLGYEPHAVEGRGSGNSRSGHYPKTVRTEVGDVGVKVPRDR